MRISETVLIIPAAGAGTRLQAATPKVLAPVGGRAMIDHLLDRYRHTVQRFVLVVHPSFETAVKDHVELVAPSLDVQFARQAQPTGMLDAILLASETAARKPADRVWVTWCDQIGVHPETISTLDRTSRDEPGTPLIFPTSTQSTPYIHLERDANGLITGIRQRREGDAMPNVGESDMGLFSLSPDAYFNLLPEFGLGAAQATETRERNFLPFIPWLVRRGHPVRTFASVNELEAVGINTPDDRRRLEAYLRTLEQR